MAFDRQSPLPSGTEPGRSFHIPSLDGLRAAAFLIVFSTHAGLQNFIRGSFGVNVFFFLSGYLITTLLRMEFDRTGGISLRQFYRRRALRILPPFYLVMLPPWILLLAGVHKDWLYLPAMLAQACHVSNYFYIYHGFNQTVPGTGVYWSLAVEEHFYLVFPLFYRFLRRRLPSGRRQMAVMLLLCAAVLAWRCFLVFKLHVPLPRTYDATDTKIDSILFGCILAVSGNPELDPPPTSNRRLKIVWLPLATGLILCTLDKRIVGGSADVQESFVPTLQSLALIPIFMAAIRFPRWGAFRLLNMKWLKFLGVLSYSSYLLHYTVIQGVEYVVVALKIQRWMPWPGELQGGASLALTVLLSTCIYYLVEKPCARLRKRFSHIGPEQSLTVHQ